MTPDKHDEMCRRGSLRSAGHGTLFVFDRGDFAVTVAADDFGDERELLAAARRLVCFNEWKRNLFKRERAFLKESGAPSPETHKFNPLVWLTNNPNASYDELMASIRAARAAGYEITDDIWGLAMKAAIYARISTTGNGQSPEMQLRELREYAARRGWEIAGEFVDAGVSGAKDSRPELNRLIADAHRRRFDAVVVWKFDRFARSVSHLLRALETFKALGIEFVSLSEQVDTSTPTGKMIFTVLGAVAELERSLIAERVRAGLRNARAKGARLGRPPIDLDTAKIRLMRADGHSYRGIAAKLGCSAASVRKTLQNAQP